MSKTRSNEELTPAGERYEPGAVTSVEEPGEPPIVDVDQLPLQLSFFEPTPVVRPEYNIGKFAGVIFTSPYAKNVREQRRHEWRLQRGNDELTASLTITPRLGLKTPTTTTLRVYLALLQVWTHDGLSPTGIVHFSARQLADLIGWRWGGAETSKRIYEHLEILSGTGLTWVLSYLQSDGSRERKLSDMSILASADYVERKSLFKEERFTAVHRVRFNPDLVENMLAGHVRPINYLALRSIANDTTLNLYTKIDLYLSKKPRWERRGTELFRQELGIESKRYEKKFARRAKLKQLVAELDGVDLCHGKLSVWIEPTADGTDDKIVAVKVSRVQTKRVEIKPICELADATAIAEDILQSMRSHTGTRSTRKGFLIFLCQRYPRHLLYEALSVAKADYQNYNKSLGAVFIWELEQRVKRDRTLTWYKDAIRRENKSG